MRTHSFWQRAAGAVLTPVHSTRRQFQRYLDYWKRDEWQDLAAAAVKALSQGEPQAMGVYLGPSKT